MKFLSPEVALYLYKFTLQSCMEYYYYFWAGAPSCYLYILDRIQKWVCRTVVSHEPFAHRRNVSR